MPHCTECGAEVSESDAYCGACGARLDGEDSTGSGSSGGTTSTRESSSSAVLPPDAIIDQANDVVFLSSNTAEVAGVFDGVDEPIEPHDFSNPSSVAHIVAEVEDLHVSDDGKVFVEDITDYFDPAQLPVDYHNNVVGILDVDAPAGKTVESGSGIVDFFRSLLGRDSGTSYPGQGRR